jgi:hypothetical protein
MRANARAKSRRAGDQPTDPADGAEGAPEAPSAAAEADGESAGKPLGWLFRSS